MPHISEYDVGTKFINRLESIGYEYADLKNYDDVHVNFQSQLAAFNAPKLTKHLIVSFFSDFDEAIAAAERELELWRELGKVCFSRCLFREDTPYGY